MDILGRWECQINHPLYNGMAYADIKAGAPYEIQLNVDSPYFPKVTFLRIEEIGNQLDLTAKIDLIPLHIKTHVVINGDTFQGQIRIPFIGEIQLKDGRRVSKFDTGE